MGKLKDVSVIVRDSESGKVYDLSNALESVIWQTHRIASQAGSLEVMVKDKPDSEIVISPGSFIRFGVDGTYYFYGNIEENQLMVSAQEGTLNRIVAYDHKYLLKSTENRYRREGMTGSEFFDEAMTVFNAKIRSMGDVGVSHAVIEPSTARLRDYYFAVSTLYTMFKETLSETHAAERGQNLYMIRDNLGTLEWRSLLALRKHYVLGDASYTDSYTYTHTLRDTYNSIKVYRDNEELRKRDIWSRYDSENISKWRYRQLTLQAAGYMSDAEISDMIDLYLSAHNRTSRTMQMACLGINGLQAGDGIQVRAAKGKIDHGVWCESVAHAYTEQGHMMDISIGTI